MSCYFVVPARRGRLLGGKNRSIGNYDFEGLETSIVERADRVNNSFENRTHGSFESALGAIERGISLS